jgi:hypothetical protein
MVSQTTSSVSALQLRDDLSEHTFTLSVLATSSKAMTHS